MELCYFPHPTIDPRPFSETDTLFDYHISCDPEVEELTVELGWRAEPAVRFWLASLREELASRLDREGNLFQRRFCCTRVEIMKLKRESRDVMPMDIHREATRLARMMSFQSEHVQHLRLRVLTPEVLSIAQQMIETGEQLAMPILADALEEAGCNWAFLLKHCRTCTDHGRRCWVLQLIERSRVVSQGD